MEDATGWTRKRFYILNGTSPGVGRTYTVSVQVNSTTSSIFTGTITAGVFSFDVKGLQAVALGDTLYIKVVASASAAATTFRGVVELA